MHRINNNANPMCINLWVTNPSGNNGNSEHRGLGLMQIPIYDNKYEIIAVENFKNNLDISDAPSYTNEGCSMG